MEKELLNTNEVRLESATAVMPELTVYCYPEHSAQMEKAEIVYGEETLKVLEITPYENDAEGISYYLLVDVSASVSHEYFEQIKEGILSFYQNMKAEDELTLITFGDQVSVQCQNQRNSQDITKIVNALENTDQTTQLFEAVRKTAELADTKELASRRKIALVITDGEDFSENTATETEALEALQENSIPLYGMAAKEMSGGRENSYIDGMGEFIRKSGGIQKVFGQEEAVATLCSLQDEFQTAYVIRAAAATNHVTYTEQPLTITFADQTVQTMGFRAVYYQEDTEAPTAEVKKVSAKELELSFSETVENAGEKENYEILIDKEQPLAVYHLQYIEEENKVKLSFQEELKNGDYKISFSNITDKSMEGNPLKQSCDFKITDGREEVTEEVTEETAEESVQEAGLPKEQILFVGAIAGLAVILCVIISWLLLRRRKGLVTIEGKAVLQKNVSAKHHVAIQKEQISGRRIVFQIEGAVGRKEIEAQVCKSLIVGRSDICDIYMDDEKMSRQHFVIYDRENGFVIEDLHTTNGTLVNGKRIQEPTELAKGDRIHAGDVQMIVRW